MLAGNIRVLALKARLVSVGRNAGRVGDCDLDEVARKRASIIGVTFRTRTPEESLACSERFAAHLLDAVGEGRAQAGARPHVPVRSAHRRARVHAERRADREDRTDGGRRRTLGRATTCDEDQHRSASSPRTSAASRARRASRRLLRARLAGQPSTRPSWRRASSRGGGRGGPPPGRGRPRRRLRRRDEQDQLSRLHRRPADGLRARTAPTDPSAARRAIRRLLGAAGGQPARVARVPRVLRRSTCRARCRWPRRADRLPGPHHLQGPGAAREGPRPPSRPRCAASRSPRPSCPPSRRPWSAAGRIATTRPRKSTSSPSPRRCGPSTGHRRRRLHPPDRRSRPRRDVGHADPGAAARGVPARRRRATSMRSTTRWPASPRSACAITSAGAAGRARTSTTSACATSWTSCCASRPRPTRSRRRRPATPTSGACGRT